MDIYCFYESGNNTPIVNLTLMASEQAARDFLIKYIAKENVQQYFNYSNRKDILKALLESNNIMLAVCYIQDTLGQKSKIFLEKKPLIGHILSDV